MNDSGYDTQDMVKVMQILNSLSQGQQPPEFLSSHPDPGNRILADPGRYSEHRSVPIETPRIWRDQPLEVGLAMPIQLR